MRAAFLLIITLVSSSNASAAGAACVMAKYLGQTLDYELVTTREHPVVAQEKAEALLEKKGYGKFLRGLDIRHSQNLTNLPHAYVIIIRSEFTNWAGREHSVMGCGFSAKSYDDAVWDAIRDAQAYYWGWKPDRDKYKIVKKLRY